MKYVAIIDSGDKELSKNAIKELKNTTFYSDEETPYRFNIIRIKEVPEYTDYAEGYNQALKDCGVIEDGERRE